MKSEIKVAKKAVKKDNYLFEDDSEGEEDEFLHKLNDEALPNTPIVSNITRVSKMATSMIDLMQQLVFKCRMGLIITTSLI